MIHPVTPYCATVSEDVGQSAVLFDYNLSGYTLTMHNTGDSVWLKVTWTNGGAIAFRIAYGMNSIFEDVSISQDGNGLSIKGLTRLAHYTIAITFPAECMFRYAISMRLRFPMLIPYWPRDIVPLTKVGRIENTSGVIHMQQEGARSGQLLFSMTKPSVGSVFYFQNLSSVSPYCEAAEISPSDAVGGNWPEVGFQFPVNPDKPIPADVGYVISDAYVILSDAIPEKADQITRQYLNHLAKVYTVLPKPETRFHDWIAIAEKAKKDIEDNKGCWSLIDGKQYLNAYVGDYKTPAEIMVQLAVLLPLMEYREWSGEKLPLFDVINNGLATFYDNRVKSIVRWHPERVDNLDKSEEQKREMVMDSWYLHHPLLNLGRLALKGNTAAKKLFLDSLEFAIRVARHFNYDWPVFYRMTTLEVLKAETEPGKGGEKDVPGSYAHVMLTAYKLTGENRYLDEAVRAVKNLDSLGFDIFYQANNTAFAAGALLELYLETKDEHYLNLSYSCVAGIFRNIRLWDADYGYSQHFQHFFSVFPLNDAPYTAAYEELEVYAALHHFLQVSRKIEILPSLRILLPEFIRYALSRMPYYYPALLPDEMIADEVKTGEVQRDLWMPIEDINDGYEKSGAVGQEVYGAGIPFAVVARQYFKLRPLEVHVFVDYPVSSFRCRKKSATFRTLGSKSFNAHLVLHQLPKAKPAKIKVEVRQGSSYLEIHAKKRNIFEIPGGSLIRIQW